MSLRTPIPRAPLPSVSPRTGHERDQLTATSGLAALALDAMASVSYGPEAVVLVLAMAGGAGIGLALPVTAAIAVLLALLVLSYRSVIAAFPDGGGAYAVSRRHLGSVASLAANTSVGGLPNLLRLLAVDHYLTHRFAHRSAHDVYRWGALVPSMAWIRRRHKAEKAPAAELPERPRRRQTIAVVPIKEVDEVARVSLSTARSLAPGHVVALHVCHLEHGPALEDIIEAWERWDVDVPMVFLEGDLGDVAAPIRDFIERKHADDQVLLVLGEPHRAGRLESALSDDSADRIAARLEGLPNVVVCRTPPVDEA